MRGDGKSSELLHNLCDGLGYKEYAAVIVKKVCAENWLNTVGDLRRVPRWRLERWGVPLKLVHELYDTLHDLEAEATLNGISGYINYTVRPSLQASYSMLVGSEEDALRDRQPEEWAARTVQGKWRWRRSQKFMQGEADGEASEDPKEFFRKPAREAETLRRHRAEEKIRRMVRRWKYRRTVNLAISQARRSGGSSGGIDPHVVLSGGPLVAAILKAWQRQGAVLKDCEVTSLLRHIGVELRRDEGEMTLHVHRLVTANWLEDLDDLRLIEEHHWAEWEFPEQLAARIKAEVAERTERDVCGGLAVLFAAIGETFAALFAANSDEDTDTEDSDAGARGHVGDGKPPEPPRSPPARPSSGQRQALASAAAPAPAPAKLRSRISGFPQGGR